MSWCGGGEISATPGSVCRSFAISVVTGYQDVVGVGLGDAGRDGADADLGDELDADPRRRVRAAQVEDQLLEVLDRIDVVVRWR